MLLKEICDHRFKFFWDINQTKYKYDASGRRIFRGVTNHLEPAKSYSRKFVYDGQNVAAILDGNTNQFLAGYMYDDGIDEPVVLVTDYNKDGQLDGLSIVKDRQNSVKLLVNEKQEIVQEVSYSAYGETQILNRGQKNPVTNNIFYYTSRELEPELGIYYYRARYYDPGTGRFLSEDPIGISSRDLNFYRYVQNSPMLFTDPTGMNKVAITLVTCALLLGNEIENNMRKEKKKACEKSNKDFLADMKSARTVDVSGMVDVTDCSQILKNPVWVEPPSMKVPDPRAKK